MLLKKAPNIINYSVIKIHLISFGTCNSLIFIHAANTLLALQWLEINILERLCAGVQDYIYYMLRLRHSSTLQ